MPDKFFEYVTEAYNTVEEEAAEYEDYDISEIPEITEEEKQFAQELQAVLQEYINSDPLIEEFISDTGATTHFYKHCLAHNETEKRSKRTNVYYDFKDVSLYKEHERQIDKLSRQDEKNTYYISSLLQIDEINKAFRKLFEGGKCIVFSQMCELRNDKGFVKLIIHSFASNVTNNYKAGNTIDMMIQSQNGKTITLYPVDANYFENKINSILRRHTDTKFDYIKINH